MQVPWSVMANGTELGRASIPMAFSVAAKAFFHLQRGAINTVGGPREPACFKTRFSGCLGPALHVVCLEYRGLVGGMWGYDPASGTGSTSKGAVFSVGEFVCFLALIAKPRVPVFFFGFCC